MPSDRADRISSCAAAPRREGDGERTSLHSGDHPCRCPPSRTLPRQRREPPGPRLRRHRFRADFPCSRAGRLSGLGERGGVRLHAMRRPSRRPNAARLWSRSTPTSAYPTPSSPTTPVLSPKASVSTPMPFSSESHTLHKGVFLGWTTWRPSAMPAPPPAISVGQLSR